MKQTTADCANILIDTDIGDDVDDAFALALAAREPALRIRAVTTVCGPTAERARLARLVLETAGCAKLPIAPGSSATSDGRPGSARFSHRPVLGTAQSQRFDSLSAIDLMLDCSRRFARLTLVALGPLTNIAAALRRDPALARRARLVTMAGKLGLPYPDWNLRCDPAAARIVLESGMPIAMVGMHVTLRCKMRPAQVRRLFDSTDPLARVLARCVLAWRTTKRRMPFLHDALAIAVVADSTIVALEPRRVRILPGGFSLASRRGPANALVCVSVDQARFHTLIEQRLLGGALPAPYGGLAERIRECIV